MVKEDREKEGVYRDIVRVMRIVDKEVLLGKLSFVKEYFFV